MRWPYPELFALVGSHVPDFRGLFLRGFGQQAHTQINGSTVGQTTTVHKSGGLREVQGDAMRDMENAGTITGILAPIPTASGVFSIIKQYWWGHSWGGGGDQGIDISLNLSNTLPTGNEIRPVNTAVRYLIRARS